MAKINATAHQKYIRQSPRKVRLVADTVRGMDAQKALEQLSYTPQRAAGIVSKVIRQAQANAVNNLKATEDGLQITEIQVNGAPILKRWRAVSRGRAHSIEKRMSHIRVTVTGEAGSEGAKQVVSENTKKAQKPSDTRKKSKTAKKQKEQEK